MKRDVLFYKIEIKFKILLQEIVFLFFIQFYFLFII